MDPQLELPLVTSGSFSTSVPSAPALAAPSAPPPPFAPTLITNADCSNLAQQLRVEHGNGVEAQMRALRVGLAGKVLSQGQAKTLMQELNPEYRAQALRELFDRQLLIDSPSEGPTFLQALATEGSMGITAAEANALKDRVQASAKQALQFLPAGTGQELVDGFDLNALPSAPPAEFAMPMQSAPPAPAAHALQAIVLVHFTGKIVSVVGDPMTMNFGTVLQTGGLQLSAEAFDPSRHYVLMVWPGKYVIPDLNTPLAYLGVPPWARVLWLENPVFTAGKEQAADPRTAGMRFQHVYSAFCAVSQSNQMCISKGELRNFFWNMNITDASFHKVWSRMDTRSRGFLDIDDLLHLVGRAHMLHPMVPIDALLYEAAVAIIEGESDNHQGKIKAPSPHFDIDVADSPHGLGVGGACQKHCWSYFASSAFSIAVPAFIVLGIMMTDSPWPFIVAGVCYIGYLIQAFCCTHFASAVGNRLEGIDTVCRTLDIPRGENPRYNWHIQCYHYETRYRTETTTDSNGNKSTRTVPYQERVNTWRNHHSGIIPSIDHTPPFVPDTTALMTEIDTALRCDFSSSNYLQCYRHWCLSNRFDIHADESRSEDLPSRKDGFIAEWVPGTRPCWIRQSMYVLFSLFLGSCCFRLNAQRLMGFQKHIYQKQCFQIEYYPMGNAHVGAAVALGGLMVGLAFGSVYY